MDPAPSPHTIISDRYQLENELGHGRLSIVYRAQDLQTNTTVALKILHPHLRTQASVVQRFRREMAAVQRLDHPAIIRIFDLIDTPDHLALVMEFAPGIDLKTWVRQHGAMPADRIIALGQVLIEAIDQAHARGILHRDLSLASIIIDEPTHNEAGQDRIEITGFGLARVDELVGLTMHTRVLGTLETMAPECVLGQPADARADIYSLGAMLFELATASPLHDGRINTGLAFAAQANSLENVTSELQKHALPDALIHTIVRALAPDPHLRFATAQQMQNALLGGYDDQTWHVLESTHLPACPACQRALLPGLPACLYCGHKLKRLIEEPGCGTHHIKIVSPYDLFKADVWFEKNTETDELTPTQIQALHKLLFSYEDTRQLFKTTRNDHLTPYVLIDTLTVRDANRISALLKERGIPNVVEEAGLKRRKNKIITRRRKKGTISRLVSQTFIGPEGLNGAGLVKLAAFAYLTASILFIANETKFTHPLAVFLMVGGGWAISLLGYWAGAQIATQRRESFLRPFQQTQDHTLTSGSGIARIPGHLLSDTSHRMLENVLPDDAKTTLVNLRDQTLQKEFQEVLEFSLRLFHDDRVPRLALKETLTPVLTRVGELLSRLGALQKESKEQRSTAEIFDAMMRLEFQLEDAKDTQNTSKITTLSTRQNELLKEMNSLDAVVYETSLVRAQLLRVRATLLDLQSQFGRAHLPSLEYVQQEIAELEIQLEAEHEVRQLLEEV